MLRGAGNKGPDVARCIKGRKTLKFFRATVKARQVNSLSKLMTGDKLVEDQKEIESHTVSPSRSNFQNRLLAGPQFMD